MITIYPDRAEVTEEGVFGVCIIDVPGKSTLDLSDGMLSFRVYRKDENGQLAGEPDVSAVYGRAGMNLLYESVVGYMPDKDLGYPMEITELADQLGGALLLRHCERNWE